MLETSDYLILFGRWIHISAVIVAVGGTFFMRIILHHAAETSLTDEGYQSLMPVVFMRWARAVHISIGVIILSGIINIVNTIPLHPFKEPHQWLYHAVFGVKMVLAVILFFVASALVGQAQALEGVRRHRATWMMFNLIVAGVIVFLSTILQSIPTVPPPVDVLPA